MGKVTGFMEYNRVDTASESPLERIKHFREFHMPLPKEARTEQAARCMECGVPFCQSGIEIGGMVSGCPLNNLIPEWNDLMYAGNLKSAYYRLISTNSFPEFTGRVCPAPCEAACTCNIPAKAVTIRDNEKSIIEYAFAEGFLKPLPPMPKTGKKIAVIGSGPAGLAAADLLCKRGHSVTVYERSDRIGGLLMYGIPNMKLEKDIVLRRISLMQKEGVEFIVNADVGITVDAKTILKDYDSIILACGASNPRDIQAVGRDAEGIQFAVDYLSKVTKKLLDTEFRECLAEEAKGKHVLVIGGGDTGNDCVGTVVRQGAKSVLQLEMMPKLPEERSEDNPWPEWPKVCKTDYGQEEATAVYGSDPRMYLTTVKEFKKNSKGHLCGAVLIKLEAKKDETTGRIVLEEIKGSETTVKVDLALIAAGFTGAQNYVTDAFQLKLSERGTLDAKNYHTSADKVFAAGDMRRGQSLVVWAIREGRETARAVDEYLMGYSNLS